MKKVDFMPCANCGRMISLVHVNGAEYKKESYPLRKKGENEEIEVCSLRCAKELAQRL